MNESVYVQHPELPSFTVAKSDLENGESGAEYALYVRTGHAIRQCGIWIHGTIGVRLSDQEQEESDEQD